MSYNTASLSYINETFNYMELNNTVEIELVYKNKPCYSVMSSAYVKPQHFKYIWHHKETE